jgi:hypothetical protein
MYRCLLLILFIALLMCAPARAQLVVDYNPPKSDCCLAGTAKTLSDQMQDWNQLGRYHAADEELMKQPADPKRVVFLGDSITDFWKLEKSFPGKPYVNRGIGGQTTPQMLVRMFPDVIDLQPAAVIILAGTNDIAQNTGPQTAAMVEENLMAMTELAQKHGIKGNSLLSDACQRLCNDAARLVPSSASRGHSPQDHTERPASTGSNSATEHLDEKLRSQRRSGLRRLFLGGGGWQRHA